MTTTSESAFRIGIDVGGTNTDAVLMVGSRVVASAKAVTTSDVISGIAAAVRAAGDGYDLTGTDRVIIGTTHFINAVVQARNLAPVATIRLCTLPAALPPYQDWPDELRSAIDGGVYTCSGGNQFDGRTLNELDEPAVCAVGVELRERGRRHVAVSSVFSPVSADQERRVGDILKSEFPDASITLSHEIGRIGLLERENAAMLNESLRAMAGEVVDGLVEVMNGLGISCGIYLTQNDGTVMSLERARRFPILTIASGPTNSMRGAAFLSDESDAVVVDVGGTTTDVGLLGNGFPRDSTVATLLGGVRSNFRMPEVTSIGIGGGSVVHPDRPLLVGPDSVGYLLTERALVFGGDTLTLTDIAVAAGVADIGDPALVRDLSADLVRTALEEVNRRIGDAVEEAKLCAAHLPIVMVGGGAVLVDPLADRSLLSRPDGGAGANAVGAALGSIGGEVDRIYSLLDRSRSTVMADARAEAIAQAVGAGAEPGSVAIVEEEDVPLTHLPGGSALRVRVKAVGTLPVPPTTSYEQPDELGRGATACG